MKTSEQSVVATKTFHVGFAVELIHEHARREPDVVFGTLDDSDATYKQVSDYLKTVPQTRLVSNCPTPNADGSCPGHKKEAA